MRTFHIVLGVTLIAISLIFPESWLTQSIFILAGAINVGIAATWDDRR